VYEEKVTGKREKLAMEIKLQEINSYICRHTYKMKSKENPSLMVYIPVCPVNHICIQNVPGGKVNILGGISIGHSKQKTLYEHVSYSERFPR
jgi:hypothetical protein